MGREENGSEMNAQPPPKVTNLEQFVVGKKSSLMKKGEALISTLSPAEHSLWCFRGVGTGFQKGL